MKNKNFITIKCPKCGYEYLPAEIFFPKSLLGSPKDIIRDDKGKIEFFNGETMNLHEEFECEECQTLFEVDATINFSCKHNNNIDFDEDYETTIYKNRIKLEEPK
jgi:endogenous inhibitor of DNA gyrase (YacG/DUF329 family)